MFSAFFIRRPIFASVISILITLAGLAAMRRCRSAIPADRAAAGTVTAVYPGASAGVITKTVAARAGAADQRRRQPAVHAVVERLVRFHGADRHCHRRRPRPGHHQRQQPRAGRHRAAQEVRQQEA